MASPSEIVRSVKLGILVPTNLLGNILVVMVIKRTKRSMRSPINYLLVNLAVADITVAIFMVVDQIFFHVVHHPTGVAGDYLCKFLTGKILTWVGSVASVCTLLAIAFERFYAIVLPYHNRSKGRMTNKKICLIVVFCWMFALLFNEPLFAVRKFNHGHIETGFFCRSYWPNEELAIAYNYLWVIFIGIIPVGLMVFFYGDHQIKDVCIGLINHSCTQVIASANMFSLASLIILLKLTRIVECATCQGNCQNFKFVIDQDVVNDNALEGHVVKTITVKSAAQCHMECRDECLCVSINYLQNTREGNCELNDVNKVMKPAALKYKPGARYYDLVRSYSVEGGRRYMPEKDTCVNKCCVPDPCFQGGRCEKPRYLSRNCKDIWKNGTSTSGKYRIYDTQNQPFLVYCDLESEPEFFWALIQSFSLENKNHFNSKVFNRDYPVDEDSLELDWALHRLSLSHMQHLAGNSTHLRVTCNFHSQGLSYTDYARADLQNHNIFDTWNQKCKLYEYLNIRGIECHNCTAATSQNARSSWLISSYDSHTPVGCDFDGRPGIGSTEHNFGRYGPSKVNPDHRCSSGPSSTTEYWFGVKRNL
ncbi:hypothetical protein OS493_023575 [Desmophyllum pertusum]|uniref:Uncharacterized protein n=1 Tax=Desmophyllum pertusum TaxID=174260 RepID=A0A9X0CW90_9CNID|nr:hypothetical protein OS493_023575 [Desmophyllum pertusum]